MRYYKLEINSKDKNSFNSISEILNVNPLLDNDELFTRWTYEVKEDIDDVHFDFINNFIDLLEPNFQKLEKIGVTKEDITFWFLYEYENQCSMEFDPERMKRLGENEITLCIDCWQK